MQTSKQANQWTSSLSSSSFPLEGIRITRPRFLICVTQQAIVFVSPSRQYFHPPTDSADWLLHGEVVKNLFLQIWGSCLGAPHFNVRIPQKGFFDTVVPCYKCSFISRRKHLKCQSPPDMYLNLVISYQIDRQLILKVTVL